MLNPRSRVVSDDVVRASRGLQVGVPADNGGLPGLAAADVSMRGPASCSGSRGDPVAPAVTAGVAQRVGGGGSGVVRLLRVLAETLQQVFAAGACCAEQLRGGRVTSAKPGLCGGGLRGAESGKGAVACANDCAEDMSDSRSARALGGGSPYDFAEQMGGRWPGRERCTRCRMRDGGHTTWRGPSAVAGLCRTCAHGRLICRRRAAA